MKGKKASVGDLTYWVARWLFIILMLVSIWYVARTYHSQILMTHEEEAHLFKNHLLYNPNALSARDENADRVVPSIFDIDNFNSERLDKSAVFGPVNDMVAANVSLEDFKTKSSIAQAYYNKRQFYNWLPLSQEGFLGIGSVYADESYTFVSYVDEKTGQTKPALLRTHILVPRT